MSFTAKATVIFLFFALLYRILLHPKQKKDDRTPPPPGPTALPVIGNLHMLGTLPHRSLQSLAKKYGPIMSLRLGQVPTIVVSSPEAAELFLKTHDAVFASRPLIQASEYVSYGSKGLAFSEYGPYWRDMRKLCTLHLLSASKVALFAPVRRLEVGLMVKSLEKAAAAREIADLSELTANLIEDITYKMVLGCNKVEEFDLKGLVQEGLEMAGAFNLSDYVPWLAPFDLQGFARRFKKISKALDEVMEKILKDHEQALNENKGKHEDFIDIMISLMQQGGEEQRDVIHRTNIKAVATDMVLAATETSATAIEWALSEILSHPRVMKNLQDELKSTVGMNRMVEETDLDKLSYLDMVLKETLRLHPVAPLLVPRESISDTMISGYHIQKKSRILVNVWAIGRDPKVWSENAETFYPERFVDKNVQVGGRDFQLIPFGSGRRCCPGIHLGLATVKLVLAQLMHSFDWKLPFGMNTDDLDMNEKFGLTIPRTKHLMAVPISRSYT